MPTPITIMGFIQNFVEYAFTQKAAEHLDPNSAAAIAIEKSLPRFTNFMKLNASTLRTAVKKDVIEFPVLISTSLTPETGAVIRKDVEMEMARFLDIFFKNHIRVLIRDGRLSLSNTITELKDVLTREDTLRKASVLAVIEDGCFEYAEIPEVSGLSGSWDLPESFSDESDDVRACGQNLMTTMRILEGNIQREHMLITDMISAFRDSGKSLLDEAQALAFPNQMFDGDAKSASIKKENDAAPTPVTLNFASLGKDKDDGSEQMSITFLVKAVLVPIPAAEVAKIPGSMISRGNFLARLAKLWIGTDSFFNLIIGARDIRANYEKIPENELAKDGISPNEFSAFAAKMRSFRQKLGESAFTSEKSLDQNLPVLLKTTMVVSTTDAGEVIFEKSGKTPKRLLDLTDKDMISRIMREFLLMKFVVVNEGTSVVTIHESGSSNIQTLTLAELRKKTDNLSKGDLYKVLIGATA